MLFSLSNIEGQTWSPSRYALSLSSADSRSTPTPPSTQVPLLRTPYYHLEDALVGVYLLAMAEDYHSRTNLPIEARPSV
ncbi:hypothetical protein AVEN_256506-1 [Araneus ventricosus]|uniref:Uncharacterized protein n=1 Tax=Araneus ventricosus TaxID=182803 RepID=A0A4Y2QUK3_ARAVE|nr:hypothetical protein AVEN_256506-1 [Araneus ventricosus]